MQSRSRSVSGMTPDFKALMTRFASWSIFCITVPPDIPPLYSIILAESRLFNNLCISLFLNFPVDKVVNVIVIYIMRRVFGASLQHSMEGFPSGQRGQTVNLLSDDFGGPNPPPSTKKALKSFIKEAYKAFFCRFFTISRNNDTDENYSKKCLKNPHRIFLAMVGEPVMEYIRKRRLMNSIDLLLNSEKNIIDISLESHFEYQQSYTRAFKSLFGLTPAECRKNRRTTVFLQKANLLGQKTDISKPDFTIGPVIDEVDEIKVIGIDCFTTIKEEQFGNPVIPKLWKSFIPRKHEIKNIINPDVDYGICINDDLSKKLGYSACCEVGSLTDIPSGMTGRLINPRIVAIFRHLGTDTKIYDSMRYIFGVWLPESGYELEDGFDMITKFDHRFHGDCEDSEFKIIVAIK